MTSVRQLMTQLEGLNPEAEVILTIDDVFIPMDYGDRMSVESNGDVSASYISKRNQRTVNIKEVTK